MNSIVAKDIQKLLENKHSEDVYVSECKGGPTWSGSHSRLDGWAMKKSWSNPLIIGYEIKVARSDFMQDNKWQSYLPYCNQFYFVCPSKVIMPEEVGDQVGLMYVSKTGTKLFTKKKAPYRDVDLKLLNDLMKYILMARTEVIGTCWNKKESEEEYWQKWLDDKTRTKELGFRVRGEIRDRYKECVRKVESENASLKRKIKKLENISEFLRKLGVDPDGYVAENRISAMINGDLQSIRTQSKTMINGLNRLIAKIDNEVN